MARFAESDDPAAVRIIQCYVPYAGPFRRLPHGPHKLNTGRHQRLRMYQSYAELLREPPDSSITVQHIVAKAGLSRRAFYELFPGGREDCFRRLTALARGLRAKRCARDEV